MASIYQRGNIFWMKTLDPRDGKLMRISLDTPDPAQAELIRKRWEAEVVMRAPEFQAVEIPSPLRDLLPSHRIVQEPATNGSITASSPIGMLFTPRRAPIEQIIQEYLVWVRAENAHHHVQSKISIIKKFFGSKAAGTKDNVAPWCKIENLSEITSAMVQRFIEKEPRAISTYRHYREVFLQLFNFAIKNNYYIPVNFLYPNPMASLPSYTTKNLHIVFLDDAQIEEQLSVLEPYPVVRMAVATMIHAGPRRAEALWLQRSHFADDLSSMSILNVNDDEKDEVSSLKTGSRPVTVLPVLKEMLIPYLAGLKGQWLFPSPMGMRWHKDNFSDALRKANAPHKLKWTCNHYRHTYATHRAREGWSIFRVAKELGNTVAIVERYYAAFFQPDALR